jgi:hypothetical protein
MEGLLFSIINKEIMIILKILVFAGALLKITEAVTMTFDIELLKGGFIKAQKYIDTYYVSLLSVLVLIMLYNREFTLIIYCITFLLGSVLCISIFNAVVYFILGIKIKYELKVDYYFISYACLILALYYVMNKPEMLIVAERLKYFVTDTIYFFLHLF